uniref:Glyceraldehyde-3-phosphate dehydrogenase-like n=1 Tax=Diabrotica virgifera virgifera TaxID=50390 RepID=A0A6P7H311_DIAVI
ADDSHEKNPKKLPWKDCGGDWVIDASGKFRNCDRAQQFIEAGATKVIISAPFEDAPMYIVGMNLDKFNHEDKIVSMASCTTNCLAPIIKVLHKRFAIEEALMTTIHSVTNSQVLIDGARPHKWRFGRGGIQNIIPAITGAAKAIGKIIPDLNGKITGLAFRVPTPIVSVINVLKKPIFILLDQDQVEDELRVLRWA